MRKRLYNISKIISMCCIVTVLGSGCASLEKESDTAETSEQSGSVAYEGVMPNELPEQINAELQENITLDGYLDVSNELTEYKVKKINLTRHILETKDTVENFLKKQDSNIVVTERKSSVKEDELLENGKAMDVYTAELEGGWIQGRDLYFTYHYNDENIFDIYTDDETDEESYLENVSRETELGFVSIEEAKSKFQDNLSFIELENLMEPQVFTFTADYLQEVADKKYEKAKKLGFEEEMEWYDLDFSEEDGYYYMRIRQGVQGVPIYCYNSGVDETMTGTYYNYPTSAACVYGKDGMVAMSITNIFDIKEEEKVDIKSFSEMLDNFCDTHSSVETTIKYIGLSYLPILKDDSKMEFSGQPVWYFVYDEVIGESSARAVSIYNAETGEIIK